MSRYKNGKILRDNKTNQLRYGTTIYKKVPESNNDIYVITQTGDRLDHLAQQFYGDQTLWWFIANTNNLSTMNIPAGTSLRIPNNIEFATGD